MRQHTDGPCFHLDVMSSTLTSQNGILFPVILLYVEQVFFLVNGDSVPNMNALTIIWYLITHCYSDF